MPAPKKPAQKKPAQKAATKSEQAVAEQVQQEMFAIPRDLLELTIGTLAELPYKTAGNLINALRGVRPVGVDDNES